MIDLNDNDNYVLSSDEDAYCEYHIFVCNWCSDTHADSDRHPSYDDWCYSCGEEMSSCDRCGQVQHENDMYTVTGDDWCVTC